jgi:Yip1-like protein
MNAASRAAAVLANSSTAWRRIAEETVDAFSLLTSYVAVLAMIPAVSGLIGDCVIGVIVPGKGTVRMPLINGLFGASFGYVATFAQVLVVALAIDMLAPRFGAKRSFGGALKLAAYSFTPVWLAGIFLLLPGLRFLQSAGLYGAAILATGLPALMGSPEEKSLPYAVAVAVFAGALILLTAAAQHWLFDPAVL